MVLGLPGGATYFFQAGTDELVNEWVLTCNYWAARQSKEPLAGGVSNMEYGWNRAADAQQRGRSASEDATAKDATAKDADTVSIRSNRSKYGKAATVRSSPWADRVAINDWKAPMTSTVPSMADEETQLESLRKHVRYITRELQQHNELYAPMTSLVRSFHIVHLTPPYKCLPSIGLIRRTLPRPS